MTPIEPGDVLLVPFPFTDQTAVKQGPAVVLSSAAYNRDHPDVILAPITGHVGGADEIVLIDWQGPAWPKPAPSSRSWRRLKKARKATFGPVVRG